MKKVKVMMRVKYVGRHSFGGGPRYCPLIGTTGSCDIKRWRDEKESDVKVQWPTGATSGDGCWWCAKIDLEPVK